MRTLIAAVAALVVSVGIAPTAGATTLVCQLSVSNGQYFADDCDTYDQPEEDEPGWDCTTMGNQVCGPAAGRDDQ